MFEWHCLQTAKLSHNITLSNHCRCVKLTLVHDMAECIVGDIVPSDGVSKEEKHRKEKVKEPVPTCQ